MRKYIDAEVLVKKMRERGWRHPDETIREFVEDDLPAADVQEVRHGRWIREPNCYYRCSVCGDHHPCIKSNMDYNYCPNCGAKMDEVERNEN